jgi:hypothetical protein
MTKKGQIIINPKTSRPVKVGSRTWLKLVKEGILEGVYDDPNELYSYAPDNLENLEEKRTELDKTLPKGKQAVKGRGKYKNKLVVRNKRLNAQDVADYTRKNTIKVVADCFATNDLNDLTDEEIREKLEKLVMREMLKEQPAVRRRQTIAKAKSKPPIYEEVESSEDEEEGEVVSDEDLQEEDEEIDFGDLDFNDSDFD